MNDNSKYAPIESWLTRMHESAAKGDMNGVESNYSEALEQANMAFGKEKAPFALLCICQSMFFQQNGNYLSAEAFNGHLREMLQQRSKLLGYTGNGTLDPDRNRP